MGPGRSPGGSGGVPRTLRLRVVGRSRSPDGVPQVVGVPRGDPRIGCENLRVSRGSRYEEVRGPRGSWDGFRGLGEVPGIWVRIAGGSQGSLAGPRESRRSWGGSGRVPQGSEDTFFSRMA